jgi:hypothetical protein
MPARRLTRVGAACAAALALAVTAGCSKKPKTEVPEKPIERPTDLKIEPGGGASKSQPKSGRTGSKGGELIKPADPTQ